MIFSEDDKLNDLKSKVKASSLALTQQLTKQGRDVMTSMTLTKFNGCFHRNHVTLQTPFTLESDTGIAFVFNNRWQCKHLEQ